MTEVLVAFDEPIRNESGTYHARVVGRLAEDAMWEGWFEFEDMSDPGAKLLVSPVESRHREREQLEYWATGLTPVYAEGALHRAQRPITVRTRIVREAPLRRPPVLNPFAVGARSLAILEQELSALGRVRLLNIISAYELNPTSERIDWMTDAQLGRFIAVSVEAQLLQRR